MVRGRAQRGTGKTQGAARARAVPARGEGALTKAGKLARRVRGQYGSHVAVAAVGVFVLALAVVLPLFTPYFTPADYAAAERTLFIGVLGYLALALPRMRRRFTNRNGRSS